MKKAIFFILCLSLLFLTACDTPRRSTGGTSTASTEAVAGVHAYSFSFAGMKDLAMADGILYVSGTKKSTGGKAVSCLFSYDPVSGQERVLYTSRFEDSVIFGLDTEADGLVFYDTDSLSRAQDLVHINLVSKQSTLLASMTDDVSFIGVPKISGGVVSFLQLRGETGLVTVGLYNLQDGGLRDLLSFPAAVGSAYYDLTKKELIYSETTQSGATLNRHEIVSGMAEEDQTGFARIENITADGDAVYAYTYRDAKDLTAGSVARFDQTGATPLLFGAGWHFQPAGNLFACYKNGEPLHLYRADNFSKELTIPEILPTLELRLSDDGKSLLVPTGESSVMVLDLTQWR